MNDKDRDLIRSYIAGDLPEDQRRSVERRAAEDEAFRKELLAEKKMQMSGNSPANTSENRHQARNQVEGSGPVEVEPEIAPRSGRWWMLAAAIAIIVAGIYYLVQNQSGASDDLFTQYFEPYPLSAYTVATEGEESVPAALQAYQQGDYQEAVNRFEATEPTLSSAPTFTFYHALSLLGNQQGGEAIPILQAVIQQADARGVTQPAEWYLALAYLQDGQQEMALETLNRITGQPNHEMNQRAEMLKAELQS